MTRSFEDCAQTQTCRAKAPWSECVGPQVLHHASSIARPAIVFECSVCLCICVRAVWIDCTLHRCTFSAATCTFSAATLFLSTLSTFVPPIPLCVPPMPVPRLFPRVVHSVCCTALRSACLFPVPWFLRSVSCVMCILRVDLFYPPCIPLLVIYTDALCIPVCSCELLIPVLYIYSVF